MKTSEKFSKFNNFLWVCWFLVENLSNFVPPAWKFYNPYCHILQFPLEIKSLEIRYLVGWVHILFVSSKSKQIRIFDKIRELGKTHGLRTLNEAFFHWNPELFGLGKQIGQINYGASGVFSAKLSAPILVKCIPWLCFPYSITISTKN